MALSASVALSSDSVHDPAVWSVRVRVRNEGDDEVRFSTSLLFPSVAFEITDAQGAPVPLGPPPVPPSDLTAGLTTLDPAASTELDYQGSELFQSAPPPGRYRLRFAGTAPPLEGAWSGRIESPWVELEVP